MQTQADGQVLLRLGQTLLAATLPGEYVVGQQLSLVVLSEPGAPPLFLLASSNNQAQAQFSSTAMLLARLQQAPQGAVVRQADPIWQQPSFSSTVQLASALAQSIKSSGLFYESHLADWAQGQLSIPALLAEPQGQLSPLLSRQVAATADTAMAGAVGVGAPQEKSTTLSPQPAQNATLGQTRSPLVDPSLAALTTVATASALRSQQALQTYRGMQAQPLSVQATGADLPTQLQSLVQQQLTTLAQGSVLWAGQIWPGQELQWSIKPDDTHRDQSLQKSSPDGWTSVLKLDLPRLGPLLVTLHISPGQHLRVRVQHAEQAAAELVRQRENFRQALHDAGLQVDELALQTTLAP
jgi:hypothetical protein